MAEDVEEELDTDESNDSGEEVSSGYFWPMPILKLVLFGIVGGPIFLIYWTFRNWSAYCRDDGYSRAPFWQGLREKTGYTPRPLWRALFGGPYCLALFPAIRRECEEQRVRPLVAPIALAWGLNLAWLPIIGHGVLPVLLLLPVQGAINRLNDNDAVKRWAVTGAEILAVAIGALLQWGRR